MELVAIENSRVIYLTQMTRPSGQLHLPEAIAKIVDRYGFAKYPSIEDLLSEKQTFSMGRFRDSQITEMGLFNDGIIISSKSNTTFLDALLEDFLTWLRSEFGLIETVVAKPEKHYESILVVKSDRDLVTALGPSAAVLSEINKVWFAYSDIGFSPSGFRYDCDPTQMQQRRKPLHFEVERRANIAFEDNVFFSPAPLKTDDHLALLGRLEALAG